MHSLQTPPLSAALDEEIARSELYGVLASLFYAAPGAELLGQLRLAATETPSTEGFLQEPWRKLVGAARAQDDASIQAEYQTLFGGVGKPAVYLYGSHYLSGFLNEKPLAALRGELLDLGLARDEAMTDTEDHFAFVCEVMRFLIAGDDVAVSNLERQRHFFGRHVQPWATQMCEQLLAHPEARFYAAVAELTQAFLAVEAQGFDMLG